MYSTSLSLLSIGLTDAERGRRMSSLTCSVTKLTHIMKNIRSCKTTSSSGVRFGSQALDELVGPWLMVLPPGGEAAQRHWGLMAAAETARAAVASRGGGVGTGAAGLLELWYICVSRSSAMLAVSIEMRIRRLRKNAW